MPSREPTEIQSVSFHDLPVPPAFDVFHAEIQEVWNAFERPVLPKGSLYRESTVQSGTKDRICVVLQYTAYLVIEKRAHEIRTPKRAKEGERGRKRKNNHISNKCMAYKTRRGENKNENQKRKYVCARYPGLCEDVWNSLPRENWLWSKQQANECIRGRVKNKVMKKKWAENTRFSFFSFFIILFHFCARANHILRYWWLWPSEWERVCPPCVCAMHAWTVFAFSWLLHAWFISTVYRLHERCSEYRCLYGTYVRLHARPEMIFFFPFNPSTSTLEQVRFSRNFAIIRQVKIDVEITPQQSKWTQLFGIVPTRERNFVEKFDSRLFCRACDLTLDSNELNYSWALSNRWKWLKNISLTISKSNIQECSQQTTAEILASIECEQ